MRRKDDGAEYVASLDFLVWRASPIAMARAHAHPDVEVNFLEKGWVRYFLGGRFREFRQGEVAVFWAGMPHQTLAKSEDVEGIWMTLPLTWMLRWRHGEALRTRLLQGGIVNYETTSLQRETFLQWEREFGAGDAALREIVAGEVEAHFSRVSLGLKKTGGRGTSSNSPGQKAEQITIFLGRHYQAEITVDEIAKAANLHPKYMLTLFRRACGMTLWEYVTRLRLAHAQRLLLTTDRTVLDVAMEAGFGSASAFYKAFRKYETREPRAFRKRG